MTDFLKGRGTPELHPKTTFTDGATVASSTPIAATLPSNASASHRPHNAFGNETTRPGERSRAYTDADVINYAEAPLATFVSGDLWADPALAVGLVFQFWRIGVGTGCRIPRPLQELLHDHVRRGDPVCAIIHRQCVWDGLADPVPTDTDLEDGRSADA